MHKVRISAQTVALMRRLAREQGIILSQLANTEPDGTIMSHMSEEQKAKFDRECPGIPYDLLLQTAIRAALADPERAERIQAQLPTIEIPISPRTAALVAASDAALARHGGSAIKVKDGQHYMTFNAPTLEAIRRDSPGLTDDELIQRLVKGLTLHLGEETPNA